MGTVRDRFLDVMNYHGRSGHLTVDETETVLGRGSGRLLALALVALADHLMECPSSPRSESARAATDAERCSPLPSGGGEPSEEEIRVVAEKIAEMAKTAGCGGPWNRLCADAVIRVLDEHRARKRGGE